MKGKEKEEKGENYFFCSYMAHAFVNNCTYNITFHDQLRGKMAAGEKIPPPARS